MLLRPAKPDERNELFNLHKLLFKEHIEQIWGWDENWQRANFAIEFDSAITSIIEIDGRSAGYLQVRYEAVRLYIQSIALVSEFQGKGIGRKIVERLQKTTKERGLPLELAVFSTNMRALRFYESCGFQTIGTSEQFFEMRWRLNSESNHEIA